MAKKFEEFYIPFYEKDEHKKSKEYKKLSPKTKGAVDEIFKVMDAKPSDFLNTFEKTIKDIETIFAKRNYKINNVILGGTNLAGCVLRSKPYSAIHWAAAGYKTQILLPLCAEYQLPGVNQADRNSHATSILYNVIRDLRLWDQIDLVRMPGRLDIK